MRSVQEKSRINRTETKLVLSLGQNIALTAEQVFAAIDDESTDPIIRDALVAFMAKRRITAPEPDKIRVNQIYGHKILR
jgi:hypothetical protein